MVFALAGDSTITRAPSRPRARVFLAGAASPSVSTAVSWSVSISSASAPDAFFIVLAGLVAAFAVVGVLATLAADELRLGRAAGFATTASTGVSDSSAAGAVAFFLAGTGYLGSCV